jgi:threonine/homoserine efflux transporter RhtA
VGLLIGAIVLAQVPTLEQALGVALVVVAGMGATRGGQRDRVGLGLAAPLTE